MKFIGTLTFAFEASDADDAARIAKGWHEKVIAASQRTSMYFRPGTCSIQAQPDRPLEDTPTPTDEPERLFDT